MRVGTKRCFQVSAGAVALLAATSFGVSCSVCRSVADEHPAPPERGEATPRAGTFAGFCEASTIVPWRGGFLVGDNEDEERLYSFSAAMEPRPALELSDRIEDIEALAVLPEGLLVVGSQSTNRRGERRPQRERVLLLGHGPIVPDLSGCAPCQAARSLPPKRGGLSVEGAARWAGSLWLGLRSPLVEGEALLLRLRGDPASSLSVAQVVRIDLEGFGVRELIPQGTDLLVLAGPAGSADAAHRLYRLRAPGAPPSRLPVELPPATEGLAPTTPEGDFIGVTDGDGQPGRSCDRPATWLRLTVRGLSRGEPGRPNRPI